MSASIRRTHTRGSKHTYCTHASNSWRQFSGISSRLCRKLLMESRCDESLLSLLTPTAPTDDGVIYVQTCWHGPGDYGNKWRWLTVLCARVSSSSREWDVIHLDSDASGGLEGAVTVAAQSKYWSVWLVTKHYRWKCSYLTDLRVCVCVRASQLCNTADDRALGGFGCQMNFEQLRGKFEYRVFVKADFYIISCLVCPRQRAQKNTFLKQ